MAELTLNRTNDTDPDIQLSRGDFIRRKYTTTGEQTIFVIAACGGDGYGVVSISDGTYMADVYDEPPTLKEVKEDTLTNAHEFEVIRKEDAQIQFSY